SPTLDPVGPWSIGSIGGSPEQRREARQQRQRIRDERRRREAGAAPREQYLERQAVSLDKPWVAAGMSSATWYRRRPGTAAHSPSNDFETGPRAPNKDS